MRQRDSSRLLDTVVAAASLSGAVMGGGSVSLFAIVMMRTPASEAVGLGCAGAGGGLFLGVASALYLYPLLRMTNTKLSIPIVFGVCTPLGVGLGAVHPLLGAGAALAAQLILCVACIVKAPPAAGPFQCESCGYDLSAAATDICPECGTGFEPPSGRIPGRCPACHERVFAEGDRPVCPKCGAVDMNLLFGKEAGERQA